MDPLKTFLARRTRGELTLLAIVAGILIFAAGIKVGGLLASVSG